MHLCVRQGITYARKEIKSDAVFQDLLQVKYANTDQMIKF